MIKETILKLREKNVTPNIDKNIQYLVENYDEQQLEILLSQGFFIDNNIKMYYYIGSGFRVMNERIDVFGRNPLCVLLEKSLNKDLNNLEILKS